jgi:hypothetical protein
MTVRELNRDINRLNERIKKEDGKPTKENFIQNEARKEFFRLYRADYKMEDLNAKSIKILLRLNLLYRFEPLHMFGIYVEL